MRYKARITPGHGRGKFLGFPTLNLVIPNSLDKKHGIYAGWVYLNRHKLPGAFHYGPVPAFDQPQPSLEVFVLDKHLTHTPSTIDFELLNRLRDIKNFSTQQDLVDQISRDVNQVRRILKLPQQT